MPAKRGRVENVLREFATNRQSELLLGHTYPLGARCDPSFIFIAWICSTPLVHPGACVALPILRLMEYTPQSNLDSLHLNIHADGRPRAPSGDVPPTLSVSSLTLNDVSFSLTATAPHISVSPSARLSLPLKPAKSKPRGPCTASSAEEKITLLPSSSSPGDMSTPPTAAASDTQADGLSVADGEPVRQHRLSIQEMNRRAHAAVAGLRAEASRLAGAVGMLPSPFDPSPPDEQLGHNTQDRVHSQADYDWATFINAYALGRWDPLKTPHPPRSHLHAPSHARAASRTTEGLDICQTPETNPSSSIWESGYDDSASVYEVASTTKPAPSHLTNSAPPQYHVPNAMPSISGGPALPTLPEAGLASRRSTMPLNLAFPHRLRNSFADMRSSSSSGTHRSPGTPDSMRPPNITNADVTTTAAAIRLAAARVSVAPLALPSPEHELTDPMRGVTATIPGSHPGDFLGHSESQPKSPNATRKTRLSSFWEGTQDVEDSRLPTIAGSPPESTEQSWTPQDNANHRSGASPFFVSAVAPATAPVKAPGEPEDEDYFGRMDSSKSDSPNDDHDHDSVSTSFSHPEHELGRSAPLLDYEPATVPALPRRICLTRQTSAPLPTLALYERRLRSTRPASESFVVSQAGRSAKEEQMFCELGYLAPPNPPDELERRRALYKFNIWNTGHDVNFDRIVHLVKLVFNTRTVVISLVDGTEQFFKSESGWDAQNMSRTTSFDAHAILQRDDEPTVVLDARDDWRFARNPLVTGHPHIRFYAGCPLRTQDGFNIGTLSIIDDAPRREFSPRQRHTLKEFAQIAMRELELWRDKIQIRIRDRIQNSMEEFTRECLEVDKELNGESLAGQGLSSGTSMEQIYERAARLVKRTLDVEGAIVMDVSHVDVLETVGAESSTSITIHTDDLKIGTVSRMLNSEEYSRLQEFFGKYPDGKICEGVLPAGLRPFLPSRIQYALSVPIFNIDKRPFAILCAYSTGERTTPFLEGHELSYLRAIGVIILSAVLKRRMILADKAKSLFISNISHELRTPLHGILASAELLSETHLDHGQASFLQTVQACGTSLVETVNHVLDFTKLSGNAKSGGVENVIQRSRVDLMQLVEEATEGCWIGHRARMFTSEIGSVYSPPKQGQATIMPHTARQVETVIDIGHSEHGWVFKCEKGGIRRVLMNLFGNSLKFTSDGYVHVMLRQQPPSLGQPSNQVKLELSVIDTGKGISQSFLKNHLFHPFSQENPLQTGTGLGLAIVNSIILSKSVDGKVDVWSAEGVGTEIKITFTADKVDDEETTEPTTELAKIYDTVQRPSVSLVGFDDPHRGVQLLRTVVSSYLVSWWGLSIADDSDSGDVVIINEVPLNAVPSAKDKGRKRPVIILSSTRGDPKVMSIVHEYERAGGFCRVVFKPVGPHRLHAALKLCLHALHIAHARDAKTQSQGSGHAGEFALDPDEELYTTSSLSRRYSEEKSQNKINSQARPLLGPRAVTAHPLATWTDLPDTNQQNDEGMTNGLESPVSLSPSSPTISVGSGASLLKTSVGSLQKDGVIRVLVVEDNAILRSLLTRWLKNKGYDFREAVDGLDGVKTFESDGYFDVVLVDLSMPILDGIDATAKMRHLESSRRDSTEASGDEHPARILALTGMSSLEDKRRAFEAGVDGYLVKPVAFKTLDMMFHKLGLS